MMRTISLLILGSLVAACNDKDKPPQPAANEWVILYSPAVPSGTPGNSFTFPAGVVHEDGVHYVVKAAPPVTLGQTITMSFSLDGSGTLKPTQGDPPGRVRLFMQRAGDDMTGAGVMVHYRWWSEPVDLDKLGMLTLSSKIDPAGWINVYGQRGDTAPEAFAEAVNNLSVIGYTFGGMFAGHGVVADGLVQFQLHSYTIK